MHCHVHTDTLLSGPSPPSNVRAVQDGLTSVRVTWTPPSPLGETTGYRISYTGRCSCGSVDVNGGNTNNYTLTNLVQGVTYTISITATIEGFHSNPVTVKVRGEIDFCQQQ